MSRSLFEMSTPFRPADFGDLGIRHEVNVFVFRVGEDGLQYLLVQPEPRHEGFWRPVIQCVDLAENLFQAAVRGVRHETGLDRAFDLVAPAPGLLHHQGDMQRIEWPMGYMLRDPRMPLRRRSQLAALRWERFDDALRTLGTEVHRQNLLQLHWRLLAA